MPYGSKVFKIIKNRKNIYAVGRDLSVEDVAKQLKARQVRAIGVVDGSGFLLGVISHSDMSDKVVLKRLPRRRTLARDIMTPRNKLIRVNPDTTIETCIELMKTNKLIHLVVETSKTNKFLGLISLTDALNAYIEDQKRYTEDLQENHDKLQGFVAKS